MYELWLARICDNHVHRDQSMVFVIDNYVGVGIKQWGWHGRGFS